VAITAPSLEQVADYISDRTLSNAGPSDAYLNTFTAATTPTDVQVVRLITESTAFVQARLGSLIDASLDTAVTQVVAVRTAAMVELSYPGRSSDLSTYDRLIALFDSQIADLAAANQRLTGAGTSADSNLLPQWQFPDPPPWGDLAI
jgi:hypothetical protein